MNKWAILGVGGTVAATAATVPVTLVMKKGLLGQEGEEITNWEDETSPVVQEVVSHLDRNQKMSLDYYRQNQIKHKGKKDYERHANYFLNTSTNNTSTNNTSWQKKFDQNKRGQQSNAIYFRLGNKTTNSKITKAWESNATKRRFDPRDVSLNVFCEKKHDDIPPKYLWQLCSSFPDKPYTIVEDKDKDYDFTSQDQIGYVFEWFLISIHGNEEFWEKRQTEWEQLNIQDSTHFKKTRDKKIKDLCKDAYYKDVNDERGKLKEDTLRFCSLDWDFENLITNRTSRSRPISNNRR